MKKKSEQEHKHFLQISSIKRVNRNLKEVSHLVVQNNGMEMYKKACAARAKLLFLLIVVFLPFSLLGL